MSSGAARGIDPGADPGSTGGARTAGRGDRPGDTTVRLPGGQRYTVRGGPGWPVPVAPFRSRVAYAAAPVVADPAAGQAPGLPATLDWEATLRYRHHLWRYGFGVAEAMDTAGRGAGLDYPACRELIRRTATEARAVDGALAAGVGTDQLPPGPAALAQIRVAYEQQLAEVCRAGAVPVLMCSRQLAAAARGPEDYLAVYEPLLAAADRPVLLHWLGEAFDPALAGYWGSSDLDRATATVLALVRGQPAKVDGIKLSLLDPAREVALRRSLPAGVRLYTGDDFHYPELIRGDRTGHSHALLGVFAAIAPAAAAALHALDAGDLDRYESALAATVPLARHLFAPPTRFYKTGIGFLSWLAGHQDHFTLIGGAQTARSPAHLGKALVLADAAGLIPDPGCAATRARAYLTVCGVPQ